MNIIVLTSSRADYGIYRPLLKALQADTHFTVRLIAFGTHLSPEHGNTIREIEADGYPIAHKVEPVITGDRPAAIATAMGKTIEAFAGIWEQEEQQTDLIICLGDRYEMFAAVAATVPFNMPVAHIHGGETTTGAIDNTFRHSLTLMARYHFTSTKGHAERVAQILGHNDRVCPVGALGLDNARMLELLDIEACREQFGIDLSRPTVLVTFHPETVGYRQNLRHVEELIAALETLDHQLLITMPNADTMNRELRVRLEQFIESAEESIGITSLGALGYWSCMRHCAFLLGNSSSGIIEAASAGKYAIDIGKRQQGREQGGNVIHAPIDKKAILAAVKKVEQLPPFKGENIYGDGHTANRIVSALKTIT